MTDSDAQTRQKYQLPGDREPKQNIERILRVDHAGEHGASRIYDGQLAILGTGSGDADLLSLRALRLMQHGDTMLYETSVPPAILDLCRKDADRIPENNKKNACRRASKLAESGLNVLWITCGPPAETESNELSQKGVIVTKVHAAS